jgi:hypothetical protein
MRLLQAVLASILLLSSPVWAIRVKNTTIPGEVVVRTTGLLDLSASGAKSKSASGPVFREAVALTPSTPPTPFSHKGTKGGRRGDSRIAPTLGSGPSGSLYLLHGDKNLSSSDLVKAAKQLPGVIQAEPNYRGTLSYVPSDPQYAQTADHFARIGIEDAWDVQQGGLPSVIVAVIDSGVDANHIDLDAAIDPASYNFVDMDNNVFDDLGHGTRVAGIIGAEANNAEGIAGAAFGVQILSLDVVDASGTLTTARTIAAINYAVAQGAKVINMSIQFYAQSQMLKDACDNAAQHAVLVASAGNENQGETPVYPASFDSVIGVGATMLDSDDRAPFSNYNGTETTLVDLVAPGMNIYTTIPGSAYDGNYTSGTSFAAPIVSGVAALLESHYPTQSPQGIVNHLRETAAPVASALGWSKIWGRVAAKNALETPLLPQLSVASVQIEDASGVNPNGAWDKGETVRLVVSLKNEGGDATGITGTLVTADPDVTISDNTGAWGNIATGTTLAAMDTLTVTASAAAIAHNVDFTLNLSANGGAYMASAPLTARIESAEKVNPGLHPQPVVWTADKTWEVHGNQIFYDGLTVEAGAVIKMAPDAEIVINGGALTAVGTKEQPILFTSLNNLSPNLSPGPSPKWEGGNYSPFPGGKGVGGLGPQGPIGPQGPVGPQNEPVNYGDYQHLVHVSINTGSDATGDGTAEHPYATIYHALDTVTDASGINRYAMLVAEGRYAGQTVQMKEWVDMYGGFELSTWMRSIEGNGTVLDGENMRRGVITSGQVRLDGFTVTKGDATDLDYPYYTYGGGILVLENSSPLITNNVISGNSASSGGGISVSTNATISNNVITGNSVTNGGGGISVSNQATATISNNVITGNSGGGGISVSTNAVISNNVITGNSATYAGGGISVLTNATISNNVITGNSGTYAGGGIYGYTNATISNCILWGNTASYGGPQVIGNITSLTYSDIQGGWGDPGVTHNIDADPAFVGRVALGMISKIAYNSGTAQSNLAYFGPTLPLNFLTGRVMELGTKAYAILSSTADTITVWGDATQGGALKLPVRWQVFDYHLRPDSPCIGAGIGPALDSNVPLTDIDSDPRSGNTCDIGADEYNAATAPVATFWGRIHIQSPSVGSSLVHCTVENGDGVFNESDSMTFANCTFRNNSEWGLDCPPGSAQITNCTATNNIAGGINAPTRDLTDCIARFNGGKGLVGNVLTRCQAYGNVGDGITGDEAHDNTAVFNNGVGLKIAGLVSDSTAEDNRGNGIEGAALECTSISNDGWAIVGWGVVSGAASGAASYSVVVGNGAGGIFGSATNSRILNNGGPGISGSGAISGCTIQDNGGEAVIGSVSLLGCVITENGDGVTASGDVQGSYIAANRGDGVTGGLISKSTILGNLNRGLKTPAGVSDSWIIGNGGIGIDSPVGNVTFSSILNNGGAGVKNLASTAALNHCNLFGNGQFDYFDDSHGNSGGAYKNVQMNYWGSGTTGQMLAHPFPFDIDRIYDQFENLFGDGWVADYRQFSTSPVGNAPGVTAPAFLLVATPNLDNPANVGLAAFTLVFSETMDTTITPAVTFGLSAPFTDHVVVPEGWIGPNTWRGTFAIGIETGDSLNTVRVAGAKAVDGFVIPDDTYHTFVIDTAPGTGINNGVAIPQGFDSMLLSWDPSDDPQLLGYSVRRALSPGGPYQLIANLPADTTSTLDTGLSGGTTYFYQVSEFDSSINSRQLTSAFAGTTAPAPTGTPTKSPTPSATASRTFTPTVTNTPTISPTGPLPTPTSTETATLTPVVTPTPSDTPTPCQTYDLSPDCQIDARDLIQMIKDLSITPPTHNPRELFEFAMHWKE